MQAFQTDRRIAKVVAWSRQPHSRFWFLSISIEKPDSTFRSVKVVSWLKNTLQNFERVLEDDVCMVTMLMMAVVAQDDTIPGVGRGSVVVGLNQSNLCTMK